MKMETMGYDGPDAPEDAEGNLLDVGFHPTTPVQYDRGGKYMHRSYAHPDGRTATVVSFGPCHADLEIIHPDRS